MGHLVCTFLGRYQLKIGTTKAFELSFFYGNFTFKVNYILLIGTVLYVLAFMTSLIAMKMFDLSIFYPVSSGLLYILVSIPSYVVLRENISKRQIGGIIIILIGIMIMNIKK